jgi:hypothetical protein
MDNKIVFIEWMDHYEDSGWIDSETYNAKPYMCETIGFLIKETKDYYSITTTMTQDKQAGNVMNIMKKFIKQFYYVTF